MKKLSVFLIANVIAINFAYTQNIGINTIGATPNPKALLDIDATGMSTKGGLLVPRMTTVDRNAITAPIPESLLIYNTTTQCFEAWNQTTLQWIAFGCLCPLPAAFTASAASGITANSFTANWTASAGATTYYIDVSTDPGFSSFVGVYNNLNVGAEIFKNLTGINCATTYYYRVRANNACGTSDNSNTITVTVTTPTAAIIVNYDSDTTLTASGGTTYLWSTTETTSAITVSPTETTTYTVTVTAPNGCTDTDDVTVTFDACGGLTSITDIRDSKVYSVIGIGNQCWMAENLNYGTLKVGTADQTNDGIADKYCYTDLESNCTIYGGLYQWAEAMQYKEGCSNSAALQPTEPVKGICPTDWHIPTKAELTTLEIYAGGLAVAGEKLKETGTTHWLAPEKATNEYGFTALGAGNRQWAGGGFQNIKEYAYFWSSTQSTGTPSTQAWLLYMVKCISSASFYDTKKTNGYSVRCIKD